MSNDTTNVTETDTMTGLFENVGMAGTVAEVTVTVAGLGSATFSDEIAAFSLQSSSIGGFADLDIHLDPLDTSGLTRSLGALGLSSR